MLYASAVGSQHVYPPHPVLPPQNGGKGRYRSFRTHFTHNPPAKKTKPKAYLVVLPYNLERIRLCQEKTQKNTVFEASRK